MPRRKQLTDKQLRELLAGSVLAKEEYKVNGVTSTQMFLCLWSDLGKTDRRRLLTLLRKAHRDLAKRLEKANERRYYAHILYLNHILTREAVLGANSPNEFLPEAVRLKEIFVQAMIRRANRYARPGTTRTIDEVADAVKRVLQNKKGYDAGVVVIS